MFWFILFSWFIYMEFIFAVYICWIKGGPRCQDGLELCPKDDSNFCVSSVAFSNDGNEIIASSNDGHLYVYDLQTQQQTLGVRLIYCSIINSGPSTSWALYNVFSMIPGESLFEKRKRCQICGQHVASTNHWRRKWYMQGEKIQISLFPKKSSPWSFVTDRKIIIFEKYKKIRNKND